MGELYEMVAKDHSRNLSWGDFDKAKSIIADVSAALVPETKAELDRNADGEVSRSEWTAWMDTVMLSMGTEKFVEACRRSLGAVRDALGDCSRLHPWIDLNFDSLGQERRKIDGAHQRGITLPQLRKLMDFLASHADADGHLQGWWDRRTGQALRTDKINLYAVADWIIKPFTAKEACSFVELVVDEGTVAQTPQWFVSHWWGEPVRDFVASVEAHAKARGVEEESAAYWVCAYAGCIFSNQNT